MLSMGVLIVSIDGGGIRGVIPAQLMANMEVIWSDVDMFAGTSTGSIVASYVATQSKAAGLVDIYKDRAKEIFQPRSLMDRLVQDELMRANYDHTGLRTVLCDVFEDFHMRDFIREGAKMIIPAYDLQKDKPKIYDERDDEYLVDVIGRSCSAPTYFPAFNMCSHVEIGASRVIPGPFIDGGVVANSPAMCALTAALASGCKLDKIWMISIGTGYVDGPRFDTRRGFDWGITQWSTKIVPLVLDGSQRLVDYQCSQILGDRYFRLNVDLDRHIGLDDYGACDELCNAADRCWTALKPEFENWYERYWGN